MLINKRNIVVAIAIVTVAAIIYLPRGCAPQQKAAMGGVTTLEMWVMPNSLEPLADIENLLKPFQAKNPNIRVHVTSVDWGAAWTKITTASTSGDVPDIVQLGSTWVGSISSMGALLDLTDRMQEIGGAQTFVPVAWSTTSLVGSSRTTAIPWFVDARAIFYRTDVFRKAGLTEKDLDTWDSFDGALAKLKSANVSIDGQTVSPLGIAGKNDWNVIHSLAPWMWGAGGDFFNSDYSASALDSSETLHGVLSYVKLVEKGYVPLEYLELNTAQVSSNFNNGSAAIYFDGPYEVKTLTSPPGQGGAGGSITARNFAVAPYPKGPQGRFTFVGGSHLAIFANSKHPNEAWEVIKYLTGKEQQVAYAKVTGFLPAVKVAFDDPFFAKDPYRRVFKEAISYGKTYPCVSSWGLLEPILTRRFGIMWDYVTSTVKIDPQEIRKQLHLAQIEMNAVHRQSK